METLNAIKTEIFIFLSLLLLSSCNSKDIRQPQTHIVEIKDMKFQPAELEVNPGDTVIWVNKDIVPHNITEEHKAWASPNLPSDSSFKKAITENASYYCSIHVVMKGKLTLLKQ